MSFVAAGIIGGTALAAGIGGAIISSNGAQNAANTQANAANQASQLQYNEFQQQQQNEQPWLTAGTQALPQLQSLAANQPQFTMSDFQQDPGYQFNLQQGQQALQRSAAAQGTLMSGGTLKALSSYNQGMASNEYQNAYNRFMNNQNTQFNRLASVAGVGQTANSQLGQAGQNMANQAGNNITGAANAQGAAQIASANAFGGALSNLGSQVPGNIMGYQQMQQQNQMMQSLMAGPADEYGLTNSQWNTLTE